MENEKSQKNCKNMRETKGDNGVRDKKKIRKMRGTKAGRRRQTETKGGRRKGGWCREGKGDAVEAKELYGHWR